MAGTTTYYQLPYPDRTDQIRLIPEQLKSLADKIDTTIEKTGAVFATGVDELPAHPGMSTGQTAYVSGVSFDGKLTAGPWYHYAGEWVRAAVDARIITLVENDDFALTVRQWQTNGQPHAFLQAQAKRDITSTPTLRAWKLGTLADTSYAPPSQIFFPVFTNAAVTAPIAINVETKGVFLNAFSNNMTIAAKKVVAAYMTWPCPALGSYHTATTE